MKKEIIEQKDNVVRVTTLNERWYAKPKKQKDTALPSYNFYPSVTWIANNYPKGIGFYKHLANKGWDRAEEIKIEAGNRGTKIHCACAELATGEEVKIDDKFKNSERDIEELTPREFGSVLTFYKFMEKFSPEVVAIEKTGFSEDPEYGGTIDYILRFKEDQKHGRTEIKKGLYLVDLKTSNNIWPSYELQLSAYSHLNIDIKGITKKEWKNRKLAFLQVGYNRNKRGWKWTSQEDKYELFKHAYGIWENENPKASPKEREYPVSIQIKGLNKNKK